MQTFKYFVAVTVAATCSLFVASLATHPAARTAEEKKGPRAAMRGTVLFDVSNQSRTVLDRSTPAELDCRSHKGHLKERHGDGHND